MNDKAMLSMEKLETELIKIIKKEYSNLELNRLLNKKFADKGLNPAKISKLMNEELYINQLNDYEKICFAYGCFEMFKDNKYLNPELYFAQRLILLYNNHITEYNKIDIIELHNFQMKNDEEYYGLISYKQIFDMMSNNLLIYNIDVQREPTYKTIGKITIPMPTVDKDAISNIEEAILNETFEDTQIVLTLLTDKDDSSDFNFEAVYENIGNITIDTPLIINDGMHRCMAVCNAFAKYYQETKNYLTGAISVRLVICDKKRARRITVQSFQKSKTSMSYLKAINDSDINRFADKIINQSKILKNNVGETFKEAKALKKLTYKTLIADVIKKLEINVKDTKKVVRGSKSIADKLDILIELLRDSNSENKNIYDLNMWAAYIAFACKMMNKEDIEIEVYDKMIDKVLNMTDEDRKILKLNVEKYSIDNIINYFEDIFDEVK